MLFCKCRVDLLLLLMTNSMTVVTTTKVDPHRIEVVARCVGEVEDATEDDGGEQSINPHRSQIRGVAAGLIADHADCRNEPALALAGCAEAEADTASSVVDTDCAAQLAVVSFGGPHLRRRRSFLAAFASAALRCATASGPTSRSKRLSVS